MSTLSRLVTDPAFSLSFRAREPAPSTPHALLVILHGVGGNEENLAVLADDVSPETQVVYPRGPLQLGHQQYGWFRVAFAADGPRIVATEAEESRSTLVRFVAQLQAAHGIEPGRTVIAGFSQGGILSASVALTVPELVRGFAVLSGRILPEIEPLVAPRLALARLDALVAHGVDDDKLPLVWAERADALLDKLGVARALRLYPGGHQITGEMRADFTDWANTLLCE